MLMRDLKWIEENIQAAINTNPDSVALRLGSLLLTATTSEEQNLTTQMFLNLPNIIGKAGICVLWEAMKFPNERWNIMEDKTRESINTLRFWILSTPAYFKQIDNTALIAQSVNIAHYRVALLALLRKASSIDHFENFNFNLLMQSSPEQQVAAIQLLISQCELPLFEHLSMLGAKSELAEFILLDLASHPKIFEIGATFADKHPLLRTSIAAKWRQYFQDFPLSSAQNEYLIKALPELKRKYSEFSDLILGNRHQRVFERPTEHDSLLCALSSYLKQFANSFINQVDLASNDCLELTRQTQVVVTGFASKRSFTPFVASATSTPIPERAPNLCKN